MWYPLVEIKLNPMFGAAAMSLSSIFVVGNAPEEKLLEGRASQERIQEKKTDSGAKDLAERKEKMTKVLKVEGMMCGHCTGRVQKALEAVEGVTAVTMSLEEKTATVELGAEVSDEALTAAVAQAGYECTKIS